MKRLTKRLRQVYKEEIPREKRKEVSFSEWLGSKEFDDVYLKKAKEEWEKKREIKFRGRNENADFLKHKFAEEFSNPKNATHSGYFSNPTNSTHSGNL